MTIEDIREFCCDYAEEILLADGFEDAFLGIVSGKMREDVACYDYDKCIDILMTRDGMTYEEAWEFFDYNVIDAYVGERTPVFLRRFPTPVSVAPAEDSPSVPDDEEI